MDATDRHGIRKEREIRLKNIERDRKKPLCKRSTLLKGELITEIIYLKNNNLKCDLNVMFSDT